MSRPESPARPEGQIRTGARFTPTFSFILSNIYLGYIILGFRLRESIFKWEAHKHLHFTKCNYNEGILCLFKRYTKQNINSNFNYFVYKISHVKKKEMICIWRGIYLYSTTSSMTLRFTILSSFLSTRNLRIDKNYTLSIFMLSGSIQFYSNIQFNLACI